MPVQGLFDTTISRFAHRDRRGIDAIESSESNQELRLSLLSHRRLISPVIGLLLDFCQRHELLSQHEQMRAAVALEEAMMNAVTHGNLEVASQLREQDHGTFERLIAVRLEMAPYQHRRVIATVRYTATEVYFVIQDEGPGFDVGSIPDPTESDFVLRTHGRGMLLMRAFMDNVTYNKVGNEVTLVKCRDVTAASLCAATGGLCASQDGFKIG